MNQQAVKIGILATLFLGGFVAADEAEDSAVAVVMKMGGKFTRDQKAPWRPVIGVNLERSKVTDAELESLGALEQLRKLWLNDTKVTDTGLKHLAPLKQLKELYANKTKITDSGLKHLANLEPLQMLSLEGNGLTDEGMKTLATFGQLQKLWLSDNPLTDAGIKELTALTQLNTLWLSRSKLTDAGLKHIAALVNLKELGFSSTQITDAGLKNLASLKKLQDLNLFRNKVTDAGLKDLAVLTGLRKLELTGTDVTEAGLLDLMKALPGCQIVSPLTKNNPQKELSIVFYHDFRKQTIPGRIDKVSIPRRHYIAIGSGGGAHHDTEIRKTCARRRRFRDRVWTQGRFRSYHVIRNLGRGLTAAAERLWGWLFPVRGEGGRRCGYYQPDDKTG